MRYHDIDPSYGLTTSHPILAEITLRDIDFHRFDQLVDNHPETKIVGHGDPRDGTITVRVACSSDDVAKALEDGWG